MQPLKSLKGIGPASLGYLKEAGIVSTGDLLEYYPRAYEFRDSISLLIEARKALENPVTIAVLCRVTGFSWFGFGPKKTLKVHMADDSDEGTLVCFGRNFLANTFRQDELYYIYGTFSLRFGEIQCSSFEFEKHSESPSAFLKIVPVYPLTSGLTQSLIRKSVAQALELEGRFSRDEIPEEIASRQGLLKKSDALYNIHFPENRVKLAKALYTIKFEEFFLFQKNITLLKMEREKSGRPARVYPLELRNSIASSLPFSLTSDQLKVLNEIYSDSISGTRMNRIVQGDVGCGKTVVGFLSAVPYIEAGYQAAFMAPTELLAKQHLDVASRLFAGSGIRIAFLSGKMPENKKKLVRQALESGEIDLIIGTHSLLSEPVKFKNLSLAIVDEQHRFGVAQRNALESKGETTDFLMMSATPIPRTLQMTFFGDISISTIKTIPSGRAAVGTHTVLEENIGKVYDWVRRELASGFQAYFIYPLIEESQHLNLKNAEAMYRHLEKEVFPDFRCAMLHSRMPEQAKEDVMRGFSKGDIKVLTATSVVEVGIDVPKATCMVIEHSDRFGLTALHQLRGRIGRSVYPSYAFLVFGRELSEDAKIRLKVIKENTDGFAIAEEDLKLRGPGDIAGLRQSGFADFRLADITSDHAILEEARKEALSFFS